MNAQILEFPASPQILASELQEAFFSAFTDPQGYELAQQNLEVRIRPDDKTDGATEIDITVLNQNKEPVGRCRFCGIREDYAVAKIIENILQPTPEARASSTASSLCSAAQFQGLLKAAEKYACKFESDFGRNISDMLENYRRMIESSPARKPHSETLSINGAEWTDIDLAIPDKANLREHLASSVEILLPNLLSQFAPSEPIYLDTRLFVRDCEDDCKVKGSKICFFLIDGKIVSLHDGEIEFGAKLRSNLKLLSAAKDKSLSPANIFCEIVRRVLDANDVVIEHLESVLNSINRELDLKGTLISKRIEDDLPDLLDSLRYCSRKLEATGRGLQRLGHILSGNSALETELSGTRSSVQNTIGELRELVSQMQDKTKDLMQQSNQILDTYKTNLNTSYESSQKRTGLVNAIALPLSLGLSAAALMVNRGMQPFTVASVSAALTLALVGWGYLKNWF